MNSEISEELSSTDYANFVIDFAYLLKYVKSDEDFLVVIKSKSLKHNHVIEQFLELPFKTQKLYLRMFLRKRDWFRLSSKMDLYIKNNVEALNELTNKGFCINEDDLTLEKAMKLLLVKEKQDILRRLKLTKTYSKLEQILDTGKNSSTSSIQSFFTKKHVVSKITNGNETYSDLQKKVFKIVKTCIGKCAALEEKTATVFEDLFLYFSSKSHISHSFSRNNPEFSVKTIAQNTLYNLYSIRTQSTFLPSYKVTLPNEREAYVKSEQEFIEYCTVLRKYIGFRSLADKKMKKEATDKYFAYANSQLNFLIEDYDNTENKNILIEHLLNRSFIKCKEQIPFIPKLSSGRYMVKLASEFIEILDSCSDYDKSVLLTIKLLLQTRHHLRKRGYWWNRLALNYEKRQQDLSTCLKIIKAGLSDEHVSKPDYYLLSNRANRICQSTSLENQIKETNHYNYLKSTCAAYFTSFLSIPEKHLKTKQITYTNKNNTIITRYVRLNEENVIERTALNEMEFFSVEKFALDYYQNSESFDFGLHAETAPFTTVFGILFWDIIYGYNNCSFISPFQIFPLDLYTDNFYTNRSEKIDERLSWILSCDRTELKSHIKDVWNENINTLQPFVNWEIFDDDTILLDFIECFGRSLVHKICKIFSTEFRTRSSGLPDLVVWNSITKEYKISEVKSTNDKLSHKQIVWINDLIQSGACVELCLVNKN